MKTLLHQHPNIRPLLLALIGVIMPMHSPSAASRNLHALGSFKPTPGYFGEPEKFVERAQNVGTNGDTITVVGTNQLVVGSRLDKPRRWERHPLISGMARIEKVTPVRSATFTTTFLNSHLSYCTSFIDNWADETRAKHIARQSYGVVPGSLDFQGFCEIWSTYYVNSDSDWAWNWYINNSAFAFHQLLYGGYGNARSGNGGGDDIEHSGLAMRSPHPIQSFLQHIYNDQTGYDALANKGWISGTIVKQGIPIHMIVAHTQADDTPEARVARAGQLIQLQDYIRWFRANNPHHAVIMMGDFNVYGDGLFPDDSGNQQSAEYPSFAEKMRANGAHAIDAAMHLPNGSQDTTYTFNTGNTTLQYFYPFPIRNESWNGRLDYFLCYDSADNKVRVIPKDYAVLPLRSSEDIDEYVCNNVAYRHIGRDLSDHYAIRGSFDLIELP